MSYGWPRIHKAEEDLERQATEYVNNHICEFFDVAEISELTPTQIEEVEKFCGDLNEYSSLQVGYSNVISEWESERGYE
jgi:hypothetical protein